MTTAEPLRRAVVLDRIPPDAGLDAPRTEYSVIAKRLGADLLGYDPETDTSVLRPVFSRSAKLGSAVKFTRLASGYDGCYVSGEGIGLPLALSLKSVRWKRKLVCVFHDMGNPKKRRLATVKKAALAVCRDMFTAFITVSERQAEVLVEDCSIPAAKVHSVLNWVDDAFFRPQPDAAVAADTFMACGAENRDYETLMRAAALMPDTQFKIYGSGFFVDRSDTPAGPPNVSWMPRVSYAALRDAYAGCAGVILPLNDVEYGAGVTGLVEAMAAGKPTVATTSRGMRNYVSSFDPHLVVRPGDVQGLVDAVSWLKANPSLGAAAGRHNRDLAEQRCSVDRYAELIARLLA